MTAQSSSFRLFYRDFVLGIDPNKVSGFIWGFIPRLMTSFGHSPLYFLDSSEDLILSLSHGTTFSAYSRESSTLQESITAGNLTLGNRFTQSRFRDDECLTDMIGFSQDRIFAARD